MTAELKHELQEVKRQGNRIDRIEMEIKKLTQVTYEQMKEYSVKSIHDNGLL